MSTEVTYDGFSVMHDGLIDGSGHQGLVAKFFVLGRLPHLSFRYHFAIYTAAAAIVITRWVTGRSSRHVERLAYLVEQGLHK